MCKNVLKLLLALIFTLTLFIEGFAQTQNHILNLREGFNFVAFNVKPSITPSQVLGQNISIDDIYAYNASAGSFISASEGALTLLNSDKGYIVKTKASTNVIITGEVMVSNELAIPIKTGFNLIGISRTPVLSKFSDLLNKYPQIIGMYKWNAASGTFIQVLKNNTGEIELLDGVDPAIASGQAYFINASEDFGLNYIRYFDTDVANSQSKTADNTGVVFNFDRGVSIEFPAIPSKIDVSEERISDDTVRYIIKSDSPLKDIIFKAPLGENMTVDDHYLLVAYPQFKFKEYIPGIVEADKCAFKILNNVTVSSPTDNNIIDPHIKDPSLVKEILFQYSAPDADLIKITSGLMISGKKYPVNDIKWPYYDQCAGECWAAAWLMLLKGYKGDLMDDLNTKNFSTLHSLLQQTGISKNEGINVYSILKVVHDKNSTYFRSGLSEISKKSEELTRKTMEGYGALHPKNIIAKIISKLNNGIPLEIILNGHAFVITGCELSEIVYNPKIYGNNSNKDNPTGNTLPGTEIGNFKDIYNPSKVKVFWTGEHYAKFIEAYYSEKPDWRICKPAACVLYSFNDKPPVQLNAKNLVTISLPTTLSGLPVGGSDKPIEDINKSFECGIGFGIVDSNYQITKTHCWTRWNWFSDPEHPEGYSWVNNGNNVDEIPEFNYIIFKKIPVYNMSGNNTKIKVSLYSGNDETKSLSSKILKDCSGISTSLSNDIYNDTYKTIYENTSQLVKEFKNELNKVSNLPDNYTIQVAVTDDGGNVILDKFLLHFKYRKLFITPDSSVNINEIKSPSALNFSAKLSDNTIIQPEQLIWTVEPADGGVTVSNGNVNILTGAAGKYVIKAVVKDTVAIHGGKEAVYEINVGSSTGLLQIKPSKFKIGIFEDTTLEAIEDGTVVPAQWSIVDVSGSVVDDSMDKTSGTISAGSSGVSSPSKSNSPGITASRCTYKAPEGHGEYIIRAAYNGKTAAVKITVMPLTMALAIPSYMDINAVQDFSVTIKGITEPKTISALSDGGKITDVNQEFKSGAIPEDNEMIFTKKFSLGANDSNDKYTITAKLLGIPIDKTVQRGINIVKSITATPKGASIAPGGKLALEASINGGGIVKAVWTLEGANSGSIIENADGTQSYVAPSVPGTYKITAKYLDYTDEMYITVTNTPSSLAITFSPLDPVIYPDEVIKIKAIVNEPKLYNGFNITNAGGELAGPVSYGVTPDAKSYFFEYNFSVPSGDNKETISIVAMIMESGEVLAKATNTIKVVRSINVAPNHSTIATGEQLTLSATIIGGEKVKAEWSVDKAESGSIVNNGDGTAVYTAPSAYGTYKITARYLEYQDDAYVTVYSGVPTIKIVCSYPSVGAGMTLYGIYADLGNRNDEVIWSSESGPVSSNGRFCTYLAPSTP
ncbi:MAG TPA: Ig-like domain-containing protein, partial [Candidatus Wallbacteria bacterium]|nr:Ig-like domain-containing protein [Candidatus Wallbacteria bacterium]